MTMAGITATPAYSNGLKALLTKPAAPAADDAASVTAWLGRLRLFNGVPFHYLVPDPRMLPPESIRFFTVDENWLGCLLDGALSLGRSGAPATPSPAAAGAPMTGFLLRSGTITAWPQMEVRALDATGAALTALRLECVAPGLLLGLFQGTLASVGFAEPPEGLHFGIELPNDPALTGATLAVKYLDSSTGATPGSQNTGVTIAPVFRDAGRRVLDVAGTAAALLQKPGALGASPPAAFTPAEFALEMVVGAQSVTYTVTASS